MPQAAQISPGQALMYYGLLWLFLFLMSLVTAMCCGFFKVPLAEAVNVQLAVSLSMDIFFVGLYLLLAALILCLMQFRAALLFIVIAFLYTLLSLAPIAAFRVWAMFAHVDLAAESFMYAMVVDKFGLIVQSGLALVGRLTGSDLSQYWPVVKDVITTASALLAILGFFTGRRRNVEALA